MAKRTRSRGISRRFASRPVGVVQTLGGRRRGGIKELAVTRDGLGMRRSPTRSRRISVAVTSGGRGWKHLTRQVPISGQTFCGQLGQGFAVLWQGISPIEVAVVFAPAIEKAYVDVNGMETSAPNMATMPRTTRQR